MHPLTWLVLNIRPCTGPTSRIPFGADKRVKKGTHSQPLQDLQAAAQEEHTRDSRPAAMTTLHHQGTTSILHDNLWTSCSSSCSSHWPLIEIITFAGVTPDKSSGLCHLHSIKFDAETLDNTRMHRPLREGARHGEDKMLQLANKLFKVADEHVELHKATERGVAWKFSGPAMTVCSQLSLLCVGPGRVKE